MKDGQRVQLDLQILRMTLPRQGGKTGQGDLVTLYEPQSRLFWWQYRPIEPGQPPPSADEALSDSIVYVTEAKIVVFTFSNPSIWLRESTERYPTLAEGQSSAQAALKKMGEEIETGAIELFRSISVAQALGADFMRLKGSASPFPEPKLREVTRKDGQWRLILDGPNKDSAKIIIGDDYQLISAVRLPVKEQ